MTSRLLVADDSITIQKIVSMAFETEAVEVEGTGNGQEAFDRISEFNPDIVLADVDMPGLDGFELSAKIKESPATSAIKVLLLASDFEDFDEERYKKSGADNHISKPFKSDDIVAMVKSLLEAPSDHAGAGESSVELADSEVIEKQKDDTELSSATPDESEADEEPSLEDLLASVEKLSTEGMPDSIEDETPEVAAEDLPVETSEPEELTEPVEISEPEKLIEPVESAVADLPVETSEPEELAEPEESAAADLHVETFEFEELIEPLADPIALEPEDELSDNDDDIMDQMIRGVEDLKESVKSSNLPVEDDFSFEEEETFTEEPLEAEEVLSNADEPEIFAEVRQRKLDNMEDLDSTFKEIVMGAGSAHHKEIEDSTELSSLGGIVPEPEDLLERITPGTFMEVGKRPATPEDIKENLDHISDFSDSGQDREMNSLHQNLRSENWGYEAGNDPFTQAIAEEVKQLLQRSLSSSLEKEVSGLSEAILQTIREVVREVTPEIARKVIREEIEKIKKQDMF